MSEQVGARGVRVRLHDTRLDGRLEDGEYALHVFVHDGSDFAGRELPAIDRGGTQQFVAPVGKPNQPSADGLVHAGGNPGGHRCNRRARVLVDDDLDQLDGKQWVPIRLLINHLERRVRQAEVAQALGDLADGSLRKSAQLNALNVRITAQPAESVLQRCLS